MTGVIAALQSPLLADRAEATLPDRPTVAPNSLIIASGLGTVDLELALDLSTGLSLAALFALGTYQARGSGASLQVQLGIGAHGGIAGIFVTALEVYFP